MLPRSRLIGRSNFLRIYYIKQCVKTWSLPSSRVDPFASPLALGINFAVPELDISRLVYGALSPRETRAAYKRINKWTKSIHILVFAESDNFPRRGRPARFYYIARDITDPLMDRSFVLPQRIMCVCVCVCVRFLGLGPLLGSHKGV